MQKRIFAPAIPPRIAYTASCVGHEERRGKFGERFDFCDETDLFGADTWEHAEAALGYTAFNLLLKKARLSHKAVGLLLAGDLQNQCVASSEGLLSSGAPFLGLYGACSTACEAMIVAAMALSADPHLRNAVVVTTSHHCAAERQFRLPLEYGGQRPPTAQWTATAGGAFLFTRDTGRVALTEAMVGRMVDAGISDAGNMGAAMAPAVVDTLVSYFKESKHTVDDVDLVVTGDLGKEGSEILSHLTERAGIDLKKKHRDCGALLYDLSCQDAHSGGSGCGCAASLMAAEFVPALSEGRLRSVLFLATGALMSPGSIQQGGNIIGIAPLVHLEAMV